jgi:PilZ domain
VDITTRRKYQRFTVKMPILVDGVDDTGHSFRSAAETLNGSLDGLGLLLDRELTPCSSLVITMPDDQHMVQIQTEIRHVTAFNSETKLVGVRFRGIQDERSASADSAQHSLNY